MLCVASLLCQQKLPVESCRTSRVRCSPSPLIRHFPVFVPAPAQVVSFYNPEIFSGTPVQSKIYLSSCWNNISFLILFWNWSYFTSLNLLDFTDLNIQVGALWSCCVTKNNPLLSDQQILNIHHSVPFVKQILKSLFSFVFFHIAIKNNFQSV